jgi:hypothetical protein
MTEQYKPETDPDRLRLVLFEVKGLYGEFNYRIPLDVKRHVTAIIAPNGSGKTLCLRLIDALFKADWIVFEKTVFSIASFQFSDGSVIEASKSHEQIDVEEDDTFTTSLEIAVTTASGERMPPLRPHLRKKGPMSIIDQYLPAWLARSGSSSWLDRRTGDNYSLHDIVENFSSELPQSALRRLTAQQPEYLEKLISALNCKLIETQRLIILGEQDDGRYTHSREARRTQYAISRKASTLKDIISREMNRYAALSQSLDRTFPGRVISTSRHLPQEQIEEELVLLDGKRKELMDVGILDTEQDVPVNLPNKRLEPAIATVLSV